MLGLPHPLYYGQERLRERVVARKVGGEEQGWRDGEKVIAHLPSTLLYSLKT